MKKKYWAFISYSSMDRRWGKWLHAKLETYRIPKELRGIQFEDGEILGSHLRPIFRDRDELSGSQELGPQIAEALIQSRFLIVLCSPNAAQSKWVNKEIQDFRTLTSDGKVLALILAGEPNATTNLSSDASLECFPPTLRLPFEPLAGDLRKNGDGKERGFLKILAGVAQVGFDDLYSRHLRAQRRALIYSCALASLIVAVLIGLSVYAFQQTSFAIAQTKLAEKRKDYSDATLYAFQIATAAKHRERGELAESWRILNSIAEERKGWEYDFLMTQFDQAALTSKIGSRSNALAFSPDDMFLAIGDDASVYVLDGTTGEKRATFNSYQTIPLDEVDGVKYTSNIHDPSRIRSVHFHNNTILATCESAIRDWSLTDDKNDFVKNYPAQGFHADLSRSGEFAAYGYNDLINVYGTADGRRVKEIRNDTRANILCIRFDASGGRLISGDSARQVSLWDFETGAKVKGWDCKTAIPQCLDVSDNGNLIAVGLKDGLLQIIDIDNNLMHPQINAHRGELVAVAICSRRNWVASAGADGVVKLWDLDTHQLIMEFKEHLAPITSICFDSIGKRLATGDGHGVVKVWDIERHLASVHIPGHILRPDFKYEIEKANFSKDGALLVTTAKDGCLKVWDTRSTQLLTTIDSRSITAKDDLALFSHVEFTTDGKSILGLTNSSIGIWQISTAREVLSRQVSSSNNRWATLHDADRIVVTGSFRQQIQIWDKKTGIEVTIPAHCSAGAISPDGKQIAGYGKRSIKLWSLTTGKELWTSEDISMLLGECIKFAENGSKIVVSAYNDAVILDASNGKVLNRLAGHTRPIECLAISTDGNRIASAGWDQLIMVWDATHGHQLLVMNGHQAPIRAVEFTSDGLSIISCDSSGEIRRWNATARQKSEGASKNQSGRG